MGRPEREALGVGGRIEFVDGGSRAAKNETDVGRSYVTN
jgi:hypothetical protein